MSIVTFVATGKVALLLDAIQVKVWPKFARSKVLINRVFMVELSLNSNVASMICWRSFWIENQASRGNGYPRKNKINIEFTWHFQMYIHFMCVCTM